MDLLNSQHLTYQNGYLHVFRHPGTYTYRCTILPQGFGGQPGSTYSIEVTDTGHPAGKGTQYEIVMRWDGKERAYHPEPAQLKIGVNDFVLWRVETQEAGIPPYGILGMTEKEEVAFDSRSLATHDVFTHLFMAPGEYRIAVNGKAAGRIQVRDHRELEPEVYDRHLKSAVLVRILGGKLEPESAKIVAGQTVLWFVEDGKNVTIAAEGAPG